jgi:hypothetical protein
MIAVGLRILKVALLAPRVLVGLCMSVDCLHRYSDDAQSPKADSKIISVRLLQKDCSKRNDLDR